MTTPKKRTNKQIDEGLKALKSLQGQAEVRFPNGLSEEEIEFEIEEARKSM